MTSQVRYEYFVDGEPVGDINRMAEVLNADKHRLGEYLRADKTTYKGHRIERRPVGGEREDDEPVRPLGLERWLARRERMRAGGMMRVEVRP
jgi:hypothetical protein